MIRIPIFSDELLLQLAPAWPGWSARAQITLLALLLVLPALSILYLARHERRLLPRRQAWLFTTFRLAILLFVWALVALQPSLQSLQTDTPVSRVLVAIDASASMDVTDPQRTSEEKEALARTLHIEEGDIDRWTRAAIAKRLLADEGVDLLANLKARHEVELVHFHQQLWQDGQTAPTTGSEATDLNLPLQRVWQSKDSGPGRWNAILLLTDGQSNEGGSPLALAKKLGQTRIPIFPVAIGGKDPPLDVAIVEVKPSSPQLAKGAEGMATVSVRFQGVPARDFTLELHAAGNKKHPPIQSKDIFHDGRDGVVTRSFPIAFEDVGLKQLEARIKPRAGTLREVSTDNNHGAALVRVGQDKLRVLLVDEDARWEYHYLATALARDEDIELQRVLFAQPRLGLVKTPDQDKLGFAKDKLPPLIEKEEDPLWSYDVILLGDIDPERLTPADRARLENYVAQRGGMLVVMAGKRWMPLAYTAAGPNDPLAKLLPLEKIAPYKWNEGFPIHLTAAGKSMPFFQIEDPRRIFGEPMKMTPDEFWAKMPKHYWGLVGEPRPGATVLADVPQVKKGLIALQTVGFGKVLFVGLDSTWRWRYAVGDMFHHQFWGQLLRWAGIDPWHTGGNRVARYGVKDSLVPHSQENTAIVRLGKDAPPLDPATAQVKVMRLKSDGAEEVAATLPLKTQENRGRQWEAKVPPLPPGSYRIDLDIPELSGKVSLSDDEKKTRRDLFTVLPPQTREMQDLAVNWDLLRNLANQSGGRLLTPPTAEEVVSILDRQTQPETKLPPPQPFWQHPTLPWWLLGMLLGMLSLEWLLRKLAGLP